LGGQLQKGCRERKCAKSFVSFASRSPEVGIMCQLLAMLISGAMVLTPGMFCGRKAKRKKICERRGASKIQIVITTLGTGQGVMYAGQVVKIECFKVKFEWSKGQRSVQHPKDIRVNGCTPRECTSACKARGFW